jgi:predicted metal-binding membrane protein
LNRDNLIVAASIVALTGISWANLTSGARGVHSHAAAQPFVLSAATWTVMMIGMMAPSALPFLTTFATMARRRQSANPLLLTAMFLAGYLIVWTGFSAIAAALQLALHALALLSGASASLSPLAGGVLIHGAFCVGCCWLLMLLPFAAGVMNLGWMLAITIFVVLEKVLPVGERLARAGGAVLAAYGAWTIWSAYN